MYHRTSPAAKALVFAALLTGSLISAGVRFLRPIREQALQVIEARATLASMGTFAAAAPDEPAFLFAASTPAEARQVVRDSLTAGPGSAPELRGLALESPDPLVAGNAVRALGRLGAVAGDAEVARLIDDPRPRLRQEVVIALGTSGDPAAIDVLEPILASEDRTLRCLAIQAVGRIGGSRSRDLLVAVAAGARDLAVEGVFLRQALASMR